MIRAVIKFQSSCGKINDDSPVTSYKKFIVSYFAFHLDHAPVISNEFSCNTTGADKLKLPLVKALITLKCFISWSSHCLDSTLDQAKLSVNFHDMWFSAYLPTFTVFLLFTKYYRRHDFTIFCSPMHPLAQRVMMMMAIIVLWLPYVPQTFYAQLLVLAKSLVTCTLILWPRTFFSQMSVTTLKHLAACKKRLWYPEYNNTIGV